MKHKCSIEIITGDSMIIFESIKPETVKQVSDRAIIKMSPEKERIKICIEAEDINALRASTNSILGLVSACEKIARIK